jgi:phosphoglycolate phosphatase
MSRHILFDLDGTLTDPAEGITGAVAFALQKMGVEPPPRKNLECFIGPPLDEAFGGKYGFEGQQLDDAVVYFREYFSTRGIWENEVYPGMPEFLQALKEEGALLYVATSKPTQFARQILEHFKLDGYFEDVEGSPLTHHGMPKAEVIREVLRRNPAIGEGAVMVGDRKHDVIGAKKAGLRSVGVLYGYGSREELEAAGADKIADDVQALRQLLLRWPEDC